MTIVSKPHQLLISLFSIFFCLALLLVTGDLAADTSSVATRVGSGSPETHAPLIRTGGQDKRVLLKKAYTIEFYMEDNTFRAEILENVAKQIRVTSYAHISRKNFLKLMRSWVDQNHGRYDQSALSEHLEEMKAILVDLRPGDEFSVTYVPNDGTYFVNNGESLGSIDGDDFAKVFFAVFVGEHPLDRTLKSKLLAYAK